MPKGFHYLTLVQRSQIYALKSKGFTQKVIAEHLEVSFSTIFREIKRNQGERGYRYQQANTMATEHTITKPSDKVSSHQ
jgi:IS30 family transposase